MLKNPPIGTTHWVHANDVNQMPICILSWYRIIDFSVLWCCQCRDISVVPAGYPFFFCMKVFYLSFWCIKFQNWPTLNMISTYESLCIIVEFHSTTVVCCRKKSVLVILICSHSENQFSLSTVFENYFLSFILDSSFNPLLGCFELLSHNFVGTYLFTYKIQKTKKKFCIYSSTYLPIYDLSVVLYFILND